MERRVDETASGSEMVHDIEAEMMEIFGESERGGASDNGSVTSNSVNTHSRADTMSSMDESSTFDLNKSKLASDSILNKKTKFDRPANPRHEVPHRSRRSEKYDSGGDSSSSSGDESTFNMHKSVKVSESMIDKHTKRNFKRPSKPRHSVEPSRRSTFPSDSSELETDVMNDAITDSMLERVDKKFAGKGMYKTHVKRRPERRETNSIENNNDNAHTAHSSSTSGLANRQNSVGERLRDSPLEIRPGVPSPVPTVVIESPERAFSLLLENRNVLQSSAFAASVNSSPLFPSASGAKQMVPIEKITTSLFSNAKPSSQETNSDDDGTTVSEEDGEEIEVEKLSRTHVTGTTSSSEQVQIPGRVMNNSSQIVDENSQSDNSFLEANSDDNLLDCEVSSQESRDQNPHIPVSASARLEENTSEVSIVPSARSFQGSVSAQRSINSENTSSATLENDRGNINYGGSSGSEMSSISRSAIQNTAAQFLTLLQINLQNSLNIPMYTVPTDQLTLCEHPTEISYQTLKSAFINPRVLIPSNERSLAQAAQSLRVVSNNTEDNKQIDESSEEELLGATASQIERRGFMRQRGIRVRSSSVLSKHPSEIYSGIGSYFQRTNSQISNTQGSSQRSANSAPTNSVQCREETLHSGEFRDQDIPASSRREGPSATSFTPLSIRNTNDESAEARLSLSNTSSEKLGKDNRRSRPLDSIPEGSMHSSPGEIIENSNILEMDALAVDTFNAVKSNSTKVSTRTSSQEKVSLVDNQSEGKRNLPHKLKSQLENKQSLSLDPETQTKFIFQESASKQESANAQLDSRRRFTFSKVTGNDQSVASKSGRETVSSKSKKSLNKKSLDVAESSDEYSEEIVAANSKRSLNKKSSFAVENSDDSIEETGSSKYKRSLSKKSSIVTENSEKIDATKSKRSLSKKSSFAVGNSGMELEEIDATKSKRSLNQKSQAVDENSNEDSEEIDATKSKRSLSKKISFAAENSDDNLQAMDSSKYKRSRSKKSLDVSEGSDEDFEETDAANSRRSLNKKNSFAAQNSDYSVEEIDSSKYKRSLNRKSLDVSEGSDEDFEETDAANSRRSLNKKNSFAAQNSIYSVEEIDATKSKRSLNQKSQAVDENSNEDSEEIDATKSKRSLSKKISFAAENSDDNLQAMDSSKYKRSRSKKSLDVSEGSDEDFEETDAANSRRSLNKKNSFAAQNSDYSVEEIDSSKYKRSLNRKSKAVAENSEADSEDIDPTKSKRSLSKKNSFAADNSNQNVEEIDATKSKRSLSRKSSYAAENSDDNLSEIESSKYKRSLGKKSSIVTAKSDKNSLEIDSRNSKRSLIRKSKVDNSDEDSDAINATETKQTLSKKSSSVGSVNPAVSVDEVSQRNSSIAITPFLSKESAQGKYSIINNVAVAVKSFSLRSNKSINKLQPHRASTTASIQLSEGQHKLRKETFHPSNIRNSSIADIPGQNFNFTASVSRIGESRTVSENQRQEDRNSTGRPRALGRSRNLPSESESESPAPSYTRSPSCSPVKTKTSLPKSVVNLIDEAAPTNLAQHSEPMNVLDVDNDSNLDFEDADEEVAIANIISVVDSQIQETPHRKIPGPVKSSKISFEESPERQPVSVDPASSEMSQSRDNNSGGPAMGEKSKSNEGLQASATRQKSSSKSPSSTAINNTTKSKQASLIHSKAGISTTSFQTGNKRKSTKTPDSSDSDSLPSEDLVSQRKDSSKAKKSSSKRGRMSGSGHGDDLVQNLQPSRERSAYTDSEVADRQDALADVEIMDEHTPPVKQSAKRKRKLTSNTERDHDAESQDRVLPRTSVGVSGTSRPAQFASKSSKKAPKQKKDFSYYRSNANIVKKEHVMAGLEVIGVKVNKSRVDALTAFASKELENMLDDLMASTANDRDNGVFTFRELELALKRRGLLDPELGKHALLLHMASVWDRTQYDKAKGVLLPKPGNHNT